MYLYNDMDFKEFVSQTSSQAIQKPWKAKRADAIDFWKNLRPLMPISIEPISKEHQGTKFRKDGIRITGSQQFIASILSRLKELLAWERPGYKLDVEYRQIEAKGPAEPPEYVFYIHVLTDSDDKKLKIPHVVKSNIHKVPKV